MGVGAAGHLPHPGPLDRRACRGRAPGREAGCRLPRHGGEPAGERQHAGVGRRLGPVRLGQAGRTCQPGRAQGGRRRPAAARGPTPAAAGDARSHGVCSRVHPRQRRRCPRRRRRHQHLRRAAGRSVQHRLRAADPARHPGAGPVAAGLGAAELRPGRDADPGQRRPGRRADRIPLARAWGGATSPPRMGCASSCPCGRSTPGRTPLFRAGARGHVLQPGFRPVHRPERHHRPRHAPRQPDSALARAGAANGAEVDRDHVRHREPTRTRSSASSTCSASSSAPGLPTSAAPGSGAWTAAPTTAP